MNKKGKVIYLEIPIKLQLVRTLNDKKRPLLKKGNKEEILRSLNKKRGPLYKQIADITIQQNEKKHDQVVLEIIDKLNIKN